MFRLLCLLLLTPLGLFLLVALAVWVNPSVVSGIGACHRIKVHRPDTLQGKCVLVMGGSAGIGQELVHFLLHDLKAQVMTTGRTVDKAVGAVRNNKNELLGAFGVELSDDDSVDKFVKDVITMVQDKCVGRKLDYLFLNAGMLSTTPNTSLAKDGMDVVFKSNFIGNARVLKRLMDTNIVARKTTRVVVTSSIAHVGGDVHHIKYPFLTPALTDEDQHLRYRTSKLAITALQQQLAEATDLDIVSVTCGYVKTEIIYNPNERAAMKHTAWPMENIAHQLLLFNPSEGAKYVLDAAFVNTSKSDEFYYPYWLPTFKSNVPTGWSPQTRFYSLWGFEWLQKLSARDGFLFVCPSAPETKWKETRQAVMEYWK